MDVDAFKFERLDGFVADVQMHQRLAPHRPLPEVLVERDAREFSFQIQRVFLAVQRVVQHGVAIVKDGFLGDGVVIPAQAGIQRFCFLSLRGFLNGLDSRLRGNDGCGVILPELLERPVGDVVGAIASFVITVNGKCLCPTIKRIEIDDLVCCQRIPMNSIGTITKNHKVLTILANWKD